MEETIKVLEEYINDGDIYCTLGGRVEKALKTLLQSYKEDERVIDRILELCMFALLPKDLYNRELSMNTKKSFKNIIRKNLNCDTFELREKIKKEWKENQ